MADKETVPVEAPKSKSLVKSFADKLGVEPEKMLVTLKSTAFKQPARKQGEQWVTPEVSNEQMMALLIVANRYNLNPFVREIYAFPDRQGIVPIVGVDGWSRMINDNRQFDGMEFEYGPPAAPLDADHKPAHEWVKCRIYRQDRKKAVEITEFFDEVYREPFKKMKDGQEITTKGPWQTHTKRMHRHKAMIQCARIAFGFTGIYDQDEAERVIEGEVIDLVTEPSRSETLSERFSGGQAETPTVGKKAETLPPEAAETQENEQSQQKQPETPGPAAAAEPEAAGAAASPAKTDYPDVTPDDILKGLAGATTADDVRSILAEAKDLKMSKAKRLTLKAAADARLTDLLPVAKGAE